MRRSCAAAALLLVTGFAPAAQARDWGFLAGGAAILVHPDDRGTDVPFLGLALAAGVFDGSSGDWAIAAGVVGRMSTLFASNERFVGNFETAFVGSLELTDGVADPFVSFGPDVSLFPHAGSVEAVIGVHADLGVHGVLFDWLFWRVAAGVQGPAAGGVRGEILVGYGFD